MNQIMLSNLDLTPYVARIEHSHYLTCAIRLAPSLMGFGFWEDLKDLCLLADGRIVQGVGGNKPPRLLPLYIQHRGFEMLFFVQMHFNSPEKLIITCQNGTGIVRSREADTILISHFIDMMPMIFNDALLESERAYTSQGLIWRT